MSQDGTGPAVDSPAWRAQRVTKTEAGRAEIKQRQFQLSRPARNLLLIVDANRSIEGWLEAVNGCTAADMAMLLAEGLVEAQSAAPAPAPAPAAPRISFAQALEAKSYKTLYDRLTAEARPRLGLMKSYKVILEVERCSGPEEIRQLAQCFVEMVREAQGDAAALAVAQILVAPG